jgi:hypothetical protein
MNGSTTTRQVSTDGRHTLKAFAEILATVPATDPAHDLCEKLASWLQRTIRAYDTCGAGCRRPQRQGAGDPRGSGHGNAQQDDRGSAVHL